MPHPGQVLSTEMERKGLLPWCQWLSLLTVVTPLHGRGLGTVLGPHQPSSSCPQGPHPPCTGCRGGARKHWRCIWASQGHYMGVLHTHTQTRKPGLDGEDWLEPWGCQRQPAARCRMWQRVALTQPRGPGALLVRRVESPPPGWLLTRPGCRDPAGRGPGSVAQGAARGSLSLAELGWAPSPPWPGDHLPPCLSLLTWEWALGQVHSLWTRTGGSTPSGEGPVPVVPARPQQVQGSTPRCSHVGPSGCRRLLGQHWGSR